MNIRAIDLLRKIGEVTTSSTISLARLSASWATRRYFWAVDAPRPDEALPIPLRLSEDARSIDFHQKSLLSDEFGIGMAALLAERELGASSTVDISVALDDPGNFGGITRVGSRQPDYLMWGAGTPYYIVECKGSQSKRSGAIDQIRSGLSQVPSVVMTNGGRPVETIVVATFLAHGETHVFVVDPPGDTAGDGQGAGEPPEGKSSLRIDERSWRIANPQRFSDRVWTGQEMAILRLVGQHATASSLGQRLDLAPRMRPYTAENVPLAAMDTPYGSYHGVSSPLLPGAGPHGLEVFIGVESELIEHATEGRHERVWERLANQTPPRPNDDGRCSFGPNGTCMIISGIDL